MTLTRDLSETEYLVGLVAGQIQAGRNIAGLGTDIAIAVGTAERICEEIIRRKDNPEQPAPLPPGVLHVDEFSSQFNDGSGKVAGIGIEWFRSDELGPTGNALTPEQVTELFTRVVKLVEEFGDEVGLQVLYDREEGDDVHER